MLEVLLKFQSWLELKVVAIAIAVLCKRDGLGRIAASSEPAARPSASRGNPGRGTCRSET